jgi:hypothetical protein
MSSGTGPARSIWQLELMGDDDRVGGQLMAPNAHRSAARRVHFRSRRAVFAPSDPDHRGAFLARLKPEVRTDKRRRATGRAIAFVRLPRSRGGRGQCPR